MAALPETSRRALLAVALGGELHADELAAVAGRDAVDDALDTRLLVAHGDRLRASHPLLAAAAKSGSRRREQRDLHLLLAAAVADEELRARHLALAASRPDAALAAAVAAAAASASARGAVVAAVELAEHALRLTPADAPERPERVLTLAGYLETAGERRRVTELLTPEIESLPAGEPRVRAWLTLLDGRGVTSFADAQRHLERALAEAGDDPRPRARVLAAMALSWAAEGVARIPEAEAWALEALPEAEAAALRALGWARSLRGQPIDDVCERFAAVAPRGAHIADSPEPVAGAARPLARRRGAGARGVRARHGARRRARRGDVVRVAAAEHVELELKAGEWDAASRRLDEWAESGDRQLLVTPTYRRCRALLAVGRGLVEEAEEWAAPALVEAEALGYGWQVQESRRALGTAALLAHDPGAGGRPPARRLGPHARRGHRRARGVPGRARPGRGARGARRSRRGAGGDRPAARAGRAAGAPVGARHREPLRRRRRARVIRRTTRRPPSRWRRPPPPMTSSACRSTRRGRGSASAGRSGATAAGAPRAPRWRRRRPRSTRSDRPAGPTARGPSSPASARAGRPRAAS